MVAGAGRARVLVVNDWLRKRFRRHGGQHRAADLARHDLEAAGAGPSRRRLAHRIAARREGARWNVLLAQNEFSVPHLRSAYAFTGPVWVEGYPRNDVLAHPERAAAVRTRLGIAADAHVVLYAPTWRDDRDTMVDYVDPAVLASSLQPDGIVLVRGHSRTLQQGARPAAAGVIDVTGYPDMADMLLIADVFVTDYSSAMFDLLSPASRSSSSCPTWRDTATICAGSTPTCWPIPPDRSSAMSRDWSTRCNTRQTGRPPTPTSRLTGAGRTRRWMTATPDAASCSG